MKVIITGASGFLGSMLHKQLSSKFEILPLTRKVKVGFQRLDLLDLDGFDWSTITPGDFVLFAAAISSPDTCVNDFEGSQKVNIQGTKSFITKCLEIGARIIFFSSDTVYGDKSETFDESETCNPLEVYANMKFGIENFFHMNNLFKSIRLSYVFSANDKFTNYIYRCEQNNEIAEVFHPFFRSVIYIQDVVQGISCLINQWENIPERIINFGGPNVISRMDFAQTLKEIALLKLQYTETKPDNTFFESRPRTIAMKSTILHRLLGRDPFIFKKAVQVEFNSKVEANNE